MPVETRHPDYEKHRPLWLKLRAQAKGECGVKDSTIAQTFLPSVSTEHVASGEYNRYLARAEYVDFLSRVVAGMVGAIMAKDPEVVDVPGLYLDDIDNRGTPLVMFAKDVLREVILMGRCGILVDRPLMGDGRSYLVRYAPEQIISWSEDEQDSSAYLRRTCLEQTRLTESSADPYVLEQSTFILELVLREGQYWQVVHEQNSDRAFVATGETRPVRSGAPLTRIPFIFIGPKSTEPAIEASPLQAIADVNVHHYQLSADLRTALWKIPLSKLIAYTNKELAEITINDKALQLEPGDSAAFLGYDAAGAQLIVEEMARDEARMIALGARAMEAQKRAPESAEALRLRQGSENATLHDIVATVSLAITSALRIMAEWDRFAAPESVAFRLNSDFATEPPDAEEITARSDNADHPNGPTLEDHHRWLYRTGVTAEPDFETWLESKKAQSDMRMDTGDDEQQPPRPPRPDDEDEDEGDEDDAAGDAE